MMLMYSEIMDSLSQERKNSISGQMSLFDMFEAEDKPSEVPVPDVGEYEKDELLTFEKEVLGVYLSGHPLDEYSALWNKNITNMCSDFVRDEESGEARVHDGDRAVVGGIISGIRIKPTKSGKSMAYFNLEDLVGAAKGRMDKISG